MSFAVEADAYDRFMGRYSVPLARVFADFAGVGSSDRVLDVGCGPGALTAELLHRLDGGAGAVSAIDPSSQFVAAARSRHPGVDVRQASAESVPFDDDVFDVAAAQLVVHFMADPVAGLADMRRVTRGDGIVAACVWDHEGGGGPLSVFWQAVATMDPNVTGEADLAGAREGHLAALFRHAGLREVEDTLLSVAIQHATFEDWWEPFTLGVGPAGAHVQRLGTAEVGVLRDRCRSMLPAAPFLVTARAWAARGRP
jgi:ubiquinone/menaquinone biosynthesis C-methylase UbiE